MMKTAQQKPVDCIFDDNFIDWVKYTLYNVNAGNHCGNPPHPSWYNAANDPKNKYYIEKRKTE